MYYTSKGKYVYYKWKSQHLLYKNVSWEHLRGFRVRKLSFSSYSGNFLENAGVGIIWKQMGGELSAEKLVFESIFQRSDKNCWQDRFKGNDALFSDWVFIGLKYAGKISTCYKWDDRLQFWIWLWRISMAIASRKWDEGGREDSSLSGSRSHGSITAFYIPTRHDHKSGSGM